MNAPASPLDAALGRLPDPDALAIESAWARSNAGDLEGAASQWRDIRARFPDRIEGYLGGGLVSRRRKAFDDADAIYRAGLEREPDNATLHVDHAWSAEERGDWLEAARRWLIVRERFSDVQEGQVRTGLALLEAGRADDAERALEAALERYPDCEEALTQYAWAAHSQGRWAEALARWERVIVKYPHLPNPRRFGAVALKELGRFGEAMGVLAPAARLYPDDPEILILNGWLATALGDFKRAGTLWRTVRERFPDEVDGVRGWAIALGDAARWDEAEAVFAAGLERFPADVQLAMDWAELPERREDGALAAERWHRLRERFPGVSDVHAGLGRALRESGQLKAAADHDRAALERFPDDLDLQVELAFTLSAQRHWTEALALWESLKRKYPDHEGLSANITSVLGQALIDQGIGNGPTFEIPKVLLEASHTEGGPARDQAALLRRFESLGDSCEFGMVQRLYHVEQMTLLRWAFTTADNLLTALKTRFDGVGDPEYTEIIVVKDEYLTRDRRYYMQSHTFTSPAVEPMESFAPEQCRRLQWLKRKLIDSLTAASRVFVYTSQGPLSDAGVLALHDAMFAYSPVPKLLVMRVRDDAHPAGHVERLRNDLWAAYIEKFSTVDISVATWLRVCQTVADQVGS